MGIVSLFLQIWGYYWLFLKMFCFKKVAGFCHQLLRFIRGSFLALGTG